MRRTLTILALLIAASCWSACGGNSNNSVNASRSDAETTINSERIDSSNIAPTGGPGAEPENSGSQSSGNSTEIKADNKNKGDNKNKNTNTP